MAAINELITQVEDRELRERLRLEAERITKEKKYGLVFEEHLPELTPIYRATVCKGSLVAQRGKPISDSWRVLAVSDGEAHCLNRGNCEKRQFSVDELVVVVQPGEPIFPTLVPVDRVLNGPNDAPSHILIEAENYHALQLLEYLYAGKVDCIYIDPPYNTRDRSWKYNNDYVDSNDCWKHSKWLSMMKKRLLLAKNLLHPQNGVLIVTIDEHEVHHLRVLLAQLFPQYYIQMITAVTNPKGVNQGRFSRVEEYVIYCFGPDAYVADSDDNLLNPPSFTRKPRWNRLLRSGTNARRVDKKSMFYPVLIDEERNIVVGAGEPLPYEENPILGEKINGFAAAWPIRTDGSFGNWGVGYVTLRKLIKQGHVACGKFDKKRNTYALTYISEPNQKLINTGEIIITGRDPITNVVSIEYASENNFSVKTVWHRTRHDAGAYGSDFVNRVLGSNASFPFPKSIYSVKDAIGAVVRNNKYALILDFFAGSGTTLNAVNLLNEDDGGNRICIMVTNNEVSTEEAILFSEKGLRVGDREWEQHGICQSVTWPRSKYTILGKRDDGAELEGKYFTGKRIEKEKPRKFQQIGFTSIGDLDTAIMKNQLVVLLGKEKLPQSVVKKDSYFIVSEKHPTSILFDETQADSWLEALEEQKHILDFYIVTKKRAVFDNIKARIIDLLGPVIFMEEEMRSIQEGFAVNLEYFRLEFLDKDQITLGREFREILPILWMHAGAIGPCAQLPNNKPIPAMILPAHNPFAVLVDEIYFVDFLEALESKEGITHVYLITDSKENFQKMANKLSVPHVVQLYKNYLENFVINKRDNSE